MKKEKFKEKFIEKHTKNHLYIKVKVVELYVLLITKNNIINLKN